MQLPNNTSIAVNKILFKYLLFFIIQSLLLFLIYTQCQTILIIKEMQQVSSGRPIEVSLGRWCLMIINLITYH